MVVWQNGSMGQLLSEVPVLDQVVAAVAQRTGLAPDKAREAVDVVVTGVKSKLPAPIAAHIDQVLAGNYSGTIGDVEVALGKYLHLG
jgi:hypothetical protein